jgi:hypothetical protein
VQFKACIKPVCICKLIEIQYHSSIAQVSRKTRKAFSSKQLDLNDLNDLNASNESLDSLPIYYLSVMKAASGKQASRSPMNKLLERTWKGRSMSHGVEMQCTFVGVWWEDLLHLSS